MELTAHAKRICPSCGGEVVWSPVKGCLVCPYCGTSVAADEGAGSVVEHDLLEALQSIPDDARGWQAEKRSVRCQQCQAISVVDPQIQGDRCAFCGSPQLVPFEESKEPFRPESLLPLRVDERTVRDIVRDWRMKRWFAPNNFAKISATDQLRGVYLPFWTFDAFARADWNAEAGYYYYETESYTDNQGVRRTRQVRHTRWEPASGHLEHRFDDVLVPASKGLPGDLLEAVAPFPTIEGLIPYDPSYIAGWTVECYQIDLAAAAQDSRNRMERSLYSLCGAEVPGDTYRSLAVQSEYSEQTFKHILAPVWLVTYTHGANTYRVLVNGVTAKVTGHYPKSVIKIVFTVLSAIILFIIFASLYSNVSDHIP